MFMTNFARACCLCNVRSSFIYEPTQFLRSKELITHPTRCIRRAAAAAALTLSATALAATYTVADLGALGDSGSYARGLNASGQVVGNSQGHAFLYSNGNMRDLDPGGGGNYAAFGISNSGQVVGWSQDAAGNLHAILYSGGMTIDLGLGHSSAAAGINDSGQVVGWFQNGDGVGGGPFHAFLFSGGTTTNLGFDSSFPYAVASGINTSGQVVGSFMGGSGLHHAFLNSQGAITDLGTLGGSQSDGYGINASGRVVGTSDRRAFLYSGGTMADLGTVPGYSDLAGNGTGTYIAYGINAAGQIVGTFSYFTPSGIGGNQYSRAWLYSAGVMRDLKSLIDPASGWDILEAAGINDAGQIAASGCGPPGCHALLLSPMKTIVVEYQNTQDFPGSPGGHFFYTDNPGEQAIVDSGIDGHFMRTGNTFKAGGTKQMCRFYGSMVPGPNSHFFAISDEECDWLKSLQKVPTPIDVQQWNYEGLSFAAEPPQIGDAGAGCSAGTIPVYRAYNNAYPPAGPKNPWDSAHRYSVNQADVQQMVTQFGWHNEGIVFCSPQ